MVRQIPADTLARHLGSSGGGKFCYAHLERLIFSGPEKKNLATGQTTGRPALPAGRFCGGD